MKTTVEFCQIRQAAIIEQAATSEETARALIGAMLSEYGYQESALMIFPYLTTEEMSRIIEKAFPID